MNKQLESDINNSAPPWHISAITPRSDGFPITGALSSLKSPVWTTIPTGVSIAMPIESGTE